jgi:hypothetical protein
VCLVPLLVTRVLCFEYLFIVFAQANAGDFRFGPTNLLFYRANLVKLLGRQNLFLKVRMRIVEDVEVNGLGRGDAILLGVEFMPIAQQQQYNEQDFAAPRNDTCQKNNGRKYWIFNT